MANENYIWKPALFSCLSAGFQGDATLQNGLHVRWFANSNLGTPLRINGEFKGSYALKVRNKGDCLKEIDLFAPPINVALPIRGAVNEASHQLIEQQNGELIAFHRITGNWHNALIRLEQTLDQLELSYQDQLTDEETDFVTYLREIQQELRPKVMVDNMEQVELCAIDLQFERGDGEVIAEDEQENRRGCNSLIQRVVSREIYAWVRAYDANGGLLDEDWVGKKGLMDLTGQPGEEGRGVGAKMEVKLRGVGISTIAIEGVPGQPNVNLLEKRWISCEEFCRAPIWDPSPPQRQALVLEPEHYNANLVRNELNFPFRRQVNDAADVAAQLAAFTGQPELIQALANATDTFAQSRNSFDPGEPVDGELQPFALPFATALQMANLDPFMARVAGTYHHHQTEERFPTDLRIQAELPFFSGENLDSMANRLAAITNRLGMNLNVDFMRRLNDGGPLVLHALVLCTDNEAQAVPEVPADIRILPQLRSLPGQEENPSLHLWLSTQLNWLRPQPFPHFLRPVGYQVERRIGQGNFVPLQTADGPPSIGMLPQMNLPREVEDENHALRLQIQDIHRTELPGDQDEITLTYRMQVFDLFGRPSGFRELPPNQVPVPCEPPFGLQGTQFALEKIGNEVHANIRFQVAAGSRDYQSVPRQVDFIFWRTLFVNFEDQIFANPNPMGQRISFSFMGPNGQLLLDQASLNQECVRLAGGDPENPAIRPENECPQEITADQVALELLEEFAPVGEMRLSAYLLSFRVGSMESNHPLEAGNYQFSLHHQIQGRCSSGSASLSNSIVERQEIFLPIPPPPLQQPPLDQLPRSTYPDLLGDAFYELNLRHFLPPAYQNRDAFVNLYLTTLEYLLSEAGQEPADFVENGAISEANWEALMEHARSSPDKFKPITDLPQRFQPDIPFHVVKVKGEREQIHMLALQGANHQGERNPWLDSAFYLFQTPARPSLPVLEFRSWEPLLAGGVAITLEAPEHSLLVATPEAVRAHLYRTHPLTGKRSFVTEIAGPSVSPGEPFVFSAEDAVPEGGQEYEYEAYLMLDSPNEPGSRIRNPEPCRFTIRPLISAQFNPFPNTEPVAVNNGNGYKVVVQLAPVEGDISLTKITRSGALIKHRGKIQENTLEGWPNTDFGYDKRNNVYRIAHLDANQEPGTYTLRFDLGRNIVKTLTFETNG